MTGLEFEKFYGRKENLALLKRRVLDFKDGYRQNLAFLGESHIGKTCLLEKFIADLDDPDVVPVYLNLDNRDFSYFLDKFIGNLLYHYSRLRQLPLHEDTRLLCESLAPSLPQTIKAVRKILASPAVGGASHSHGKTVEAYRELLALPQIFTKESGKLCLLILDEFHNLEEVIGEECYPELGKWIMTQKHCLYVLASSFPSLARRILSEKLALLFGDFEVVEIGAFDLKTSEGFVRSRLGNLRLGDSLCHFLIDFTGGHPLYLDLIAGEMLSVGAMHKQSEVFIPVFLKTIEHILFDRWGVLSRHFELLLDQITSGKGNMVSGQILLGLADGRQKLPELVKNLQIKQAQISSRLNRLMEMEVVVKNGHYYYLKDKLLRYWLKYVYRKRQKFIDSNPEQLCREFHDELTRSIENFGCQSQKDLSARIIELLHCFDNEALLINGRRYKLPLFHELTPKRICKASGECFDVIQAATTEGEWWIVLNSESLVESDISLVLSESKKAAQKIQRCLLISLNNLDENARLKALQERMWIWNEGELNALLDLYNKPYILRPVIEP